MPADQHDLLLDLQAQRYEQLSTERHSRSSLSLVSSGSAPVKLDEERSTYRKDGYVAVMYSGSVCAPAHSALMRMHSMCMTPRWWQGIGQSACTAASSTKSATSKPSVKRG